MLKHLMLIAALAVTSACASLGGALDPGPAPAPLEKTVVDDQALAFGFEAFDAVLYLVDGMVAAGVIVPGTARALELQRYLMITRNSLNAASAARKAGSATDYRTAMEQANRALGLAKNALGRS